MYSTKQIEKILLANTKKSVLARKIQFINKYDEFENNSSILVFVNNYVKTDTIFLYYCYYDSDDKGFFHTENLIRHLIEYIGEKYDYWADPSRFFNTPFIFIIEPQKKIISTIHEDTSYYGIDNAYNIYSNEDTKKILKDLIKNNIITTDFKLKIGNKDYLIKDIFTNKNTPIKYSKRGNPLMYHGTSKENWEQIKKTGGLKPRMRDSNTNDIETFLESLVYLTTSFNVAKSYSQMLANPEDAVILLVEVPDKDKLYTDTGYTLDVAYQIIEQLSSKDFTTNNKDIQAFRNNLVFPENPDKELKFYSYFKGFRNKIYFNIYLFDMQTFMKAVIDEDFSIIERSIPKWIADDELTKEEEKLFTQRMYELYNIFVKYYKSTFNSPKALRQSANNLTYTKNAVAYHGRIPLSYIRGVFDINGQRIE